MKHQIMDNSEQTSYIIEFTQSNDNYKVLSNNDITLSAPADNQLPINIEEIWTQSINHGYRNDNIAINTNTYTVSNVNYQEYNDDIWNNYGTYTIECTNKKPKKNQTLDKKGSKNDDITNRNFIFISNTQKDYHNKQNIEPLDVCETILNTQEFFNKEFEFSFNNGLNKPSNNHRKDLDNSDNNIQRLNDSLYNSFRAASDEQMRRIVEDYNLKLSDQITNEDVLEEISHHFSVLKNEENNIIAIDDMNIIENNANVVNYSRNLSPILTVSLEHRQKYVQNKTFKKHKIQNGAAAGDDESLNYEHFDVFNFKNRLFFVPKGMSPIFENCHTKNACEYNLTKDYYDDEMYSNFANSVQNNADIFEPKIKNTKEFSTNAIDKVNAKLNKDNASLKFDKECLKGAKVLAQIDEKFIAAIMKDGRNNNGTSEYLILFDQHAVHERIRLEKNLSDYFRDSQWKSTALDEVTIKMAKDDVLYLHNYKDKFTQLGLQWTVLNSDEISITGIPEAILGNNPRPVEKVLKAVKNLITEEINIIKMQGGCISLYPKSIMDLVFSEACRYAIKFGDKLSKSECIDFLKALSECKTPFQCAHGRPVMAVITDIITNKFDFKINVNKLKEWNRGRQKIC